MPSHSSIDSMWWFFHIFDILFFSLLGLSVLSWVGVRMWFDLLDYVEKRRRTEPKREAKEEIEQK